MVESLIARIESLAELLFPPIPESEVEEQERREQLKW